MNDMEPSLPRKIQPGIGVQYYATQLGTYDEMHAKEGQLLPHWEYLMTALDRLGSDGLERRRKEADRLLRETGVTYNVYDDPRGTSNPWRLDPVPLLISSEEWLSIERGLIQRVELLDLILTDLYGPQELIKKGLLPMELVYSHLGFLRPCMDIPKPAYHHLIIHSSNLARGPDGRMWVLDDRTQAPSGAGYALENRTVMMRILPSLFRDAQVHRLAVFFRGLRTGLANIAPQNKDNPHIVVLTPGPLNETYFEQAYLAAYLGYTLVQGDDLMVRDGKVWLKSLQGLQQVDVILRRLDDYFCDPLELRSDSQLGVTGLVEASRLGNVAIANPIGSSILENPGLLAFLPEIARYFLGEDLKLPSVATWWCGQNREREFVLNNLDQMVIKPTNRNAANHAIFGADLSQEERKTLSDRIRAKPHLFVGQQQVSFSTAPSFVDGQIEPRHAILRTFQVARDRDYVVMPGGLTRIAPQKGAFVVSNQAGGVSKDTWVLASEPEKQVSLWLQPQRGQRIEPLVGPLPSRSAENLFWVARYAERAEVSARLMRTVLQKLQESREFHDPNDYACLAYLLCAITHVTGTYPGFVGKGGKKKQNDPRDELLSLALEATREGSLAHTLQSFTHSAFSVRDLWSSDTWRMVDKIQQRWQNNQNIQKPRLDHLEDRLNRLIINLVAFSGLTTESMVRETGWLLLDIGRRLERALCSISLLRGTLVPKHDSAVENQVMEAVLATCESVITFRRRYRAFMQLPTVIELLILDENHPRALAYQIKKLKIHIEALPREQRSQRLYPEERLILETYTEMRLAEASMLSKNSTTGIHKNLDHLLSGLSRRLWELSDVISNTYFSHAQSSKLIETTPVEDEL